MNTISKHKPYFRNSSEFSVKQVSVLKSTTVTGSEISLESTLLDHNSGQDTQLNTI